MPVQANPAPLLQTPQKHRPAPPPPPCKISGKSRYSTDSTKMHQAFYDLFEKQSIRHRYIFTSFAMPRKHIVPLRPFTSLYARIAEKRGAAGTIGKKKYCSFIPANPASGGNRAGIPLRGIPARQEPAPTKTGNVQRPPATPAVLFPKILLLSRSDFRLSKKLWQKNNKAANTW